MGTDRVRVLHIIQNLDYGGMERLIADLVRRMDASRFVFDVLCLQYPGRFADDLESYAGLHVAPRLSRYSMLWPGELISQIRSLQPDVVHTHSGVWYKASLAARKAGVRWLVHTEHGRPKPDPWVDRLLDGLAARRTDVVVAVSDVLADQLPVSIRVPKRRIRTVLNGVDTESFCPQPDDGRLRRELNLAADVPIIGSVGRLGWIKGYDIMLRAYAKLLGAWDGGPEPVLVIAGGGVGRYPAERPALERLIEQLGLSPKVHMLGWRDDVHSLHSCFTIFTLASRSEGTCVALLEAMSAGICPVVTGVGGNPAVLGAELAHRLVQPEDPSALVVAWQAALADRERRELDGSGARRRIVAAFDVARTAEEYEGIYLSE